MPQKFWEHQCPGKSPYLVGSPRACACGKPTVYAGWRNSRFEAMAWSQKFHGLKPIGPHRVLQDRLFAGARKRCGTCSGRGYFDAANDVAFEVCNDCEGAGCGSTISLEERARLRAQVLAEYPDAAARSDLPHPAFSNVVHDLGRGEVIVIPIPGRH